MDKVGVIIGAYDGSAESFGPLAASLKEAGYYVVVGYDANETLPDAEAVNSCDYFFSGGGSKGKSGGHLWAIREGLGLLCDIHCNYFLSVTGDVSITKPEKIPNLIRILGDQAVMTSQWHEEAGTLAMFGKSWQMHRVFSGIQEGPPQLEKKFTRRLRLRNITPAIHPCRADDKGTWGIIGYKRGRENYMP